MTSRSRLDETPKRLCKGCFRIATRIFVLAHFLMRSGVPEWFKLMNYIGSSLGAILFLASPWTVRYVSIKTATLFYVGALAVGVTLASQSMSWVSYVGRFSSLHRWPDSGVHRGLRGCGLLANKLNVIPLAARAGLASA